MVAKLPPTCEFSADAITNKSARLAGQLRRGPGFKLEVGLKLAAKSQLIRRLDAP